MYRSQFDEVSLLVHPQLDKMQDSEFHENLKTPKYYRIFYAGQPAQERCAQKLWIGRVTASDDTSRTAANVGTFILPWVCRPPRTRNGDLRNWFKDFGKNKPSKNTWLKVSENVLKLLRHIFIEIGRNIFDVDKERSRRRLRTFQLNYPIFLDES